MFVIDYKAVIVKLIGKIVQLVTVVKVVLIINKDFVNYVQTKKVFKKIVVVGINYFKGNYVVIEGVFDLVDLIYKQIEMYKIFKKLNLFHIYNILVNFMIILIVKVIKAVKVLYKEVVEIL